MESITADEGDRMRLLLAFDGSECAETAAAWLARFAFSPEDEIVVLYVVSDLPYEDDYKAQIQHAIKRVAPRILETAVELLKPIRAKILTAEREGYPDAAILDIANVSKVDMIVMGARGLGKVKSFFLGSTSRNVANTSPVSVLITRPVPGTEPERMHILLAADGSPSSQKAAQLLAALPFPDTAEITVLNVVWSSVSDLPERYSIEISDALKQTVAMARAEEMARADRIIRDARSILGRRYRSVSEKREGGDPAQEILRAAEETRADLIAVGSRGLRGMKSLLGSVSRRVLGHAACPVLIGKAE